MLSPLCNCTTACGCDIQAADTNCINTTVTGDGSPGDPYVISAEPIIDPAPGNTLTCEPTGLRVEGAAASHTHDDPIGGPTALVVGGTNEAGPTVPTATSLRSIAIGDFALAGAGFDAIAIGSGADAASAPKATLQGAIAIGASGLAASQGPNAIAIGAIAIGSGTTSGSLTGASASGVASIAIGSSGTVTGLNAVGLGLLAVSSGNFSVAIGSSPSAASNDAIAIGRLASAASTRCIAIGREASAANVGGIAIGSFATAPGAATQEIAIGSGVNVTAAPEASAQGAIAVGASNGVAILGARASAVTAIAIGSGTALVAGASATDTDAIAIGNGAVSAFANSIALGQGVAAANINQVNTGTKPVLVGCPTFTAGGDLVNSQVSFSQNEALDLFVITVRDSVGNVLTGTVALV